MTASKLKQRTEAAAIPQSISATMEGCDIEPETIACYPPPQLSWSGLAHSPQRIPVLIHHFDLPTLHVLVGAGSGHNAGDVFPATFDYRVPLSPQLEPSDFLF